MKTKLMLILFLGLVGSGYSQFNVMPLNFPENNYHPWFLDAVDTNTTWVGVNYVNSGGYLNYSKAIKTTDGGATWQFSNIPETGVVNIFDVCAVDSIQCYYVTYNGTAAIWRTMDGGTSWVKVTPMQFVGGWANFYYAASPDTGIAGGDPNNGYWEIQLTNDGGDTWTRVPSANIPSPLSQEYGIAHGYSAAGNHVWFSTSKGRCFHSADKGNTWTAVQVPGTWTHPLVTFVDTLRGVFYDQSPYFPTFKSTPPAFNVYYMTVDGGLTWTEKTIGDQYFFRNFSKVPGNESSMVIGVYDSTQQFKVTVFFTPDFMDQIFIVESGISSSGEMDFCDSGHGWLAGPGTQMNNIYKFSGDLWTYVGVPETTGNQYQLQIYPNPADRIITVETGSPSTKNLILFNSNGQELIHRSAISSKTEMDISRLHPGLYFIKVVSDEGVRAGRFVKK